MPQELSDQEVKNAFDKLKIKPELYQRNSDNLDNGIKTMTLDS